MGMERWVFQRKHRTMISTLPMTFRKWLLHIALTWSMTASCPINVEQIGAYQFHVTKGREKRWTSKIKCMYYIKCCDLGFSVCKNICCSRQKDPDLKLETVKHRAMESWPTPSSSAKLLKQNIAWQERMMTKGSVQTVTECAKWNRKLWLKAVVKTTLGYHRSS